MKSLKNISRKVGFTNTETNVILFLVLAFIIGVSVNLLKDSSNQNDYLEFNYGAQDSLFDAASGDPFIEDSTSASIKKIDSKPELLDFAKAKSSKVKNSKLLPGGKLININTASEIELLRLPGIGSKTVQNIVTYRNQKGLFKKPEDLLKIKGIGTKKFDKLKNLITTQ